MNDVLVRKCNHQDIEAIFQLDKLWDEENIAHVFTYGSQEAFIADYDALSWSTPSANKIALSTSAMRLGKMVVM